MKAKFYTVKFQFPLLWKLFLATGISLSFAIMTLPKLRKAIYTAFPIKLVAVHFNSVKEKDAGTSLVNMLESTDGSIYAIDKYNITKFTGSTVEKELSRKQFLAISNGKYQPLKSFAEIDNILYAGDWYGGFYSKQSGKWKKVFQAAERHRILGIFKDKDNYYLISSKGIFVLSLQFKLIKKELENEYVKEPIIIQDQLYILTRKHTYQLKDKQFVPIYTSTKELSISKLAKCNGELLLLTKKGAMYLEKDGSLTPKFLFEHYIDDYTTDGKFEVVTVYKHGIFIRKNGSDWIQFPSPGKSKARSSGLIIKNDTLWAAYYTSGLFRIDFKRLLELEDEL